jgi:hypothetical protein
MFELWLALIAGVGELAGRHSDALVAKLESAAPECEPPGSSAACTIATVTYLPSRPIFAPVPVAVGCDVMSTSEQVATPFPAMQRPAPAAVKQASA